VKTAVAKKAASKATKKVAAKATAPKPKKPEPILIKTERASTVIDSMVRNAMCNAASAFGLATSNDAIIDNSIEKKIFDVKSEETLAECHEKLMDNLKIEELVKTDDLGKAFMRRDCRFRHGRDAASIIAVMVSHRSVIPGFCLDQPSPTTLGEIDQRLVDLVMFMQKTEIVYEQISSNNKKLRAEKVKALLDAGLTEKDILEGVSAVMASVNKEHEEAEASCQK
jgi:hypothetical protein